jgi:hypothetical protein
MCVPQGDTENVYEVDLELESDIIVEESKLSRPDGNIRLEIRKVLCCTGQYCRHGLVGGAVSPL